MAIREACSRLGLVTVAERPPRPAGVARVVSRRSQNDLSSTTSAQSDLLNLRGGALYSPAMTTTLERIRDAMNAHDAERVAALIAGDYRSSQPVHPGRGFG